MVVQDWLLLTWRGRWEMAYYAVRRLVVDPAPAEDRCFMGAPVGEHVHCPRRAEFLWCSRHEPRDSGQQITTPEAQDNGSDAGGDQ